VPTVALRERLTRCSFRTWKQRRAEPRRDGLEVLEFVDKRHFRFSSRRTGCELRPTLQPVELIGYLAGALCVACLAGLFALGDRRIRIAVFAFVVLVLGAYALFVTWVYLVGRD
jgi:hypothetical protein